MLLSDVGRPLHRAAAVRSGRCLRRFRPGDHAGDRRMAGSAGSELSRGGMKQGRGGKDRDSSRRGDGDRKRPSQAPACCDRRWRSRPPGSRRNRPRQRAKAWIASHLEPRGTITGDAARGCRAEVGQSLLPAGFTASPATFHAATLSFILADGGVEIVRGLIACRSRRRAKIVGKRSSEIEFSPSLPRPRRDEPSRTIWFLRDG